MREEPHDDIDVPIEEVQENVLSLSLSSPCEDTERE
jgi:hypothetical protein